MQLFVSTVGYLFFILQCELPTTFAAELVSVAATTPGPASSSKEKTSLRIVEDFLSDEQEIQDFLVYFEDTENIHTPSSSTLYTNRYPTR
jgi:hypothetical protein